MVARQLILFLIAIVAILVVFVVLSGVDLDERESKSSKDIANISHSTKAVRQNNNQINIVYQTKKDPETKKDKSNIRVISQFISYEGPKGDNTPFYIIEGDDVYETQLPIGNIPLDHASVKIFDQDINLSTIGKITKKQYVRISIDPKTKTVRSIFVEDNQTTQKPKEQTGDLPNLVIQD